MYIPPSAGQAQHKSQNHLGGNDIVELNYNFTGELTSSTRTHVENGVTTTIANGYTYDHMGAVFRKLYDAANRKGS